MFIGKRFAVLKTIIYFALSGGIRDRICVFDNTAYWVKKNSEMNGNRYSLTSLKKNL